MLEAVIQYNNITIANFIGQVLPRIGETFKFLSKPDITYTIKDIVHLQCETNTLIAIHIDYKRD